MPPTESHRDGKLWRYEAEQVYRWVPMAETALAEGEHTVQIYELSSGPIRIERICLVKGEALPPSDLEW